MMTKRLLVALVAVLSVGALAAPADAATNHAAVVIDTGEGLRRATITFSEPSISGLEALRRAGANPVVKGYGGLGGAVCMIDGVGYPVDPCLADKFWAYHRAPAGATSWTFSPIGAGSTQVRNGDVEGWRWGTGSSPRQAPALPPPPPPPPPGTSGGSGTPASPGGGAAAPRNGPAAEHPNDPTNTTASPGDPNSPEVEAERVRERDRDREDERGDEAQAAGFTGNDDTGNDSGSPIGVLVAAAILAALVATAVIVQRRRRAAPT